MERSDPFASEYCPSVRTPAKHRPTPLAYSSNLDHAGIDRATRMEFPREAA
jgi:hypothetical protein